MSTAPVRQFSVEEYLAFERQSEAKHQYFRGEILAMTGGSLQHVTIISNLVFRARSALGETGCRVLPGDMRVKCPSGLYTYPDVVIMCSEPQLEDSHRDTLLNPLVIFEVLSPSTEAYDRSKKFESYRGIESLREYVLVAQDQMHVEHFVRQRDANHWDMHILRRAEEELSISNGQGRLKLSEIYESVEFAPANADSQPAN